MECGRERAGNKIYSVFYYFTTMIRDWPCYQMMSITNM